MATHRCYERFCGLAHAGNSSVAIRLVVLCLALFPVVALAQGGLSLGPAEGMKDTIDQGGQGWWDLISTFGTWASIIAGGLLWVAGLTQYIRWAFVALIIFAFGDMFAAFVFGLGGGTISTG